MQRAVLSRRRFTRDLCEIWLDEEVGLLAEVPNNAEAARLMHNMIVAHDLIEFLTPPAYELLDSQSPLPTIASIASELNLYCRRSA